MEVLSHTAPMQISQQGRHAGALSRIKLLQARQKKKTEPKKTPSFQQGKHLKS